MATPTDPYAQILENTGSVTVWKNSNGTFTVEENGTYTLIKDMGSTTPTTISSLVAADYYDGYRVVLFAGGHTWYMNSNWQKDNAGPGGANVTQLDTTAFLSGSGTIDTGTVVGTYRLTSSKAFVSEGSTFTFYLSTTNVPIGTPLNYTISGAGVSAADFMDSAMNGTVVLDASGSATIQIMTASDETTEGNENLTITIENVSASVVLNDTSIEILRPTWHLKTIYPSIIEGNDAVFNLSTLNARAGARVFYLITGVSDRDFQSFGYADDFKGSVVLDSNGEAVIKIPIKVDSETEGDEKMTVSVNGASASVLIKDSILWSPKVYIGSSSADGQVSEGSNVFFYISTTNVKPGTTLRYTISGVASSDIGDGIKDGTLTTNANGQAELLIPIAADNLEEGVEVLTLTIEGESKSIKIIDTSKPINPAIFLVSPISPVSEGSTAKFIFKSAGAPAKTEFTYVVSGITAEDVNGGILNGKITTDIRGEANIFIPIAADNATEGAETLTVTVEGASASVQILDTSKQTGGGSLHDRPERIISQRRRHS